MEKCFDATALGKEDTLKLNEIAMQNKKIYVDFVDFYSALFGDDDMWWSTSFASRNNVLDLTFQNLCLFILCKDIIASKQYDTIIVPTLSIKNSLIKYCKKHNINVSFIVKGSEKTRKRFSYIWVFYGEIKKYCKIRFFLRKYNYFFDKRDEVSLIAEPVLSSCVNDRIYQDRYFTNIQEYTKEKIVILPSLSKNTSISWENFIKNLLETSNAEFLFVEKFIKLIDFYKYLKFLYYCKKMSQKEFFYQNDDISNIVRESFLNDICSVPSLKGVMTEKLMERMHKSGINVKNFLAWYEGRPSDIMLCKSFRKHYPGINCVGYEGFALSEQKLGLYISEEQYQKKACPVKIAVGGSMYEQSAKQFCRELVVVKAPILRTSFERRTMNSQRHDSINILLVLSYFRETSAEMIKIINDFVQNNKDIKINILVKNHPDNDGKKIDYYTDESNFVPQYVNGKLIDCLKDIDMVFTSKSTSSLEIICQDVYLIELCEKGKIHEKIIPDGVDVTIYRIVYDEEDFQVAFSEYKKTEKYESRENDWQKLLLKPSVETVAELWAE